MVVEQGVTFGGPGAQPLVGVRGRRPGKFLGFNIISLVFNE